MLDRPVYPIGVVAEMLDVTPETIRSWEKTDVLNPRRRSGKRFYSDLDVARLRFIKELMSEGLTAPGIRYYLRLYPCWEMEDCPGCMSQSESAGCAKPCWKVRGTYCKVSSNEDLCAECDVCQRQTASEK
jgi:MerR family transcriptional regulator/heat shock protein HspR